MGLGEFANLIKLHLHKLTIYYIIRLFMAVKKPEIDQNI